MPCQTEHYDGDLRAQIDQLTRLLCYTCQRLYSPAPTAMELESELSRWWSEHQAADRRRLDREAHEQRQRELKSAAFAKLTPEERAALRLQS